MLFGRSSGEECVVKRILVVDDEESILKIVDYALTEAGYEVHLARDGAGAELITHWVVMTSFRSVR